jgi:hypothetical protein
MYPTHPIDKQEVMAYLDGELPAERAAAVAAHLEQCAECRSAAEEFRSVGRQLLAWQVEASPAGFADPVRAALEASAQAKTRASPRKSLWGRLGSPKPLVRPWVWGLAGTALVALFLLSSIPGRMVTRLTNMVHSPALPSPAYSGAGQLREEPQAAVAQWQALSPSISKSLVGEGAAARLSQTSGPMIVRTAELALVTREFDQAREAIERTLRQRHGYVGQLNVNAPAGAGRTLTATLRVPADQCDAVLNELKKLGRVERESQAGEDVTKQYVDLSARLSNARNTEQRLIDVLGQRTGKVADILAVEQEVARVRGEIESMEAEKKSFENRVAFATLQLRLSEEYKAQLEVAPPSVGMRVHNAAVEGYQSAVQAALDLLLTLLSAGPTVLLWALILLALYCLSRALWRRLRPD